VPRSAQRPPGDRPAADGPAGEILGDGHLGDGLAADASGAVTAEVLVAEVGAQLRARGERMTGPRRAVLTALAQHGGHLSAEDVIGAVAAVDPSVHRASVYRTLEALSRLGVVQHLHVGHGGTAHHLVTGHGPHLHAQCRMCGTVHDLPGDLLDEVAAVLAGSHRFALEAGHVALSGLCQACAPLT
jgi:Fe2+ or Zn2+ uptake regulation protein